MAQIDRKEKKLLKERKVLDDEKRQWYSERKRVEEMNKIDDEVLDLNVSGVKEGFSVRKSLLCSIPESTLEAQFSGRHPHTKSGGAIFVDRNPKMFEMVLNYLRNGGRFPTIQDPELKKLFEEEIDYWQLDPKNK